MNRIRIPLLMLLAMAQLCLSSAYAAKLLLPENIELSSVNGKDLGFRLLNQPKHLDLDAGTQLLQLNYRDLIESDDDSHQTIRSDEYFLRFVLERDTTYALICESPSDEEGAWEFSKDPHFSIKEVATGKTVEIAKLSIKEREESLIDSLMKAGSSGVDNAPKSLEQAQIAKRQASQATVAASSTATTAVVAGTSAVISAEHTSDSNQPLTAEQTRALEMLIYWWSEADETTRQAFMNKTR